MSVKRGLVPLVVVALVALVYWPGLHGFWTRDDFMQLAFARLVGSPWPLFVRDHYFPVPGSVFRPLGFASFWLWQALFGTDYFAHAFGDMLLHVAVCLALYRVLRGAWLERTPAVLCTLLFAVHPVVLGTALWWSARFDLLATLFALIAVRAAFDHVDRPRAGSLLVVLASLLAALLSKETALAGAAAIGMVWLRTAWADRARRGQALRAVGALVVLVLLFFAWRTAVLGTLGSGLAGDAPLVDALGRGFADWIANLPGYLLLSSGTGSVLQAAIVAALMIVLVALAAGLGDDERRPFSLGAIDLLVCGACVFVLPAVLQAPVAALNAAPFRADASAVETAMQSRLYYLSFAGLALALGAAVGRVWSDTRVPRAAVATAFAIGMGVAAWISHGHAAAFAARTSVPRAMAVGVAAAVDRIATARDRCDVAVLGSERPPEWAIYVSMDSVTKALSTNIERTGRCFVHADYPTFFNLMRGDATPTGAWPYTPHENQGHPVPWLHVGDLVAAYLDPPVNADANGVVFLRYENGAFVETAADPAALH